MKPLTEIKKEYGELSLREVGISGIAFKMGQEEQAQEFEKMILNKIIKEDLVCNVYVNGWNNCLKELLKEVQGGER